MILQFRIGIPGDSEEANRFTVRFDALSEGLDFR